MSLAGQIVPCLEAVAGCEAGADAGVLDLPTYHAKHNMSCCDVHTHGYSLGMYIMSTAACVQSWSVPRDHCHKLAPVPDST